MLLAFAFISKCWLILNMMQHIVSSIDCLYFHENATLNIVYYCDQFYLSCSILAINRPCSATNTKDEPNLICHSLLEFCSIIDFQGCECCCLLSVFSSKFQSSMRVLLHLFIRGVIRKTTMMT